MYQVELVFKSKSKLVSKHRLLSAAGSRALKVLNENKGKKDFKFVRILDPEGNEHSRLLFRAEHFV